ncbi:MAG: SagB/ThcOx family dehydrogenase [Chloroflexota bacterium]|nr:SagB/ThcOx family dehydrogenase [Chloroflexota bacterium]
MTINKVPETIELPPPDLDGSVSLEAAIARRRTVREFSTQPLPEAILGQLLWAANGITDRLSAKRAAPSAGARFPLEFYAVLPQGVFLHDPRQHVLRCTVKGDIRSLLVDATSQDFIAPAPCTFAIAAVFSRTVSRYGERGERRYVPMDVGHAAENLLLQATALGLIGCPVGSFDDRRLAQALALPPEQEPLYLIPVGWRLDS